MLEKPRHHQRLVEPEPKRRGRLTAIVMLVATLALFGSATPVLADDSKDAPTEDSETNEDGEKKSKKKKSSKKKSNKDGKSKKKSSDAKKSSKKKSSSKKAKSNKDDDKAKVVHLADIAVAEYTGWIDDGLATKKDNDIVSIRHAISCGDKLIKDLLKQGKVATELDKDDRDDAEFTWRYEEICDPPEKKKKSSGNGKKKKKTKKKVSTANKLRQAEKARIQIAEWIEDDVFDKDDPAIEAILFTLDCADAMIEYTLDAGREAIDKDRVGVREVIHAHEDICEGER